MIRSTPKKEPAPLGDLVPPLHLNDASSKKPKRIFKRTANESERSSQSRKSMRGTRASDLSSDFKPAFIKSTIINIAENGPECVILPFKLSKQEERFKNCFTSIQNNTPPATRRLNLDAHIDKLKDSSFQHIPSQNNQNRESPQHSRSGSGRISLHSYRPDGSCKTSVVNQNGTCNNVSSYLRSHFEEELKLRNQEIEILQEQKQRLAKLNTQLNQKCNTLQGQLMRMEVELNESREENKKMVIQKKKMEVEKQALVRKIAFLEKINYSTQTKNLQSFREEHLEKELVVLKERLNHSKTDVENYLETELNKVKEEVFNSRKLIESLEISKACLQQKLDKAVSAASQSQEYVALRNKYKKFLGEYRDLKRDYDKLAKQHKLLQNLMNNGNTADSDYSLELSLF